MKVPPLYYKLPFFLQNFLLSVKGWQINRKRYNKSFLQYLWEFEKTDPSQVNIGLLREFLKNAGKSPFWRDRFLKYEINVDSNNPIEEIQKLPILTKDEVKMFSKEFKISILDDKVEEVRTSGTTGGSLIFQQTRTMENKQWAIWWRYRKRYGLNLSDWMGWFGGKLLVSKDQQKPPFYRINYFGKQIMFSPIHLNRKNAISYYKEIEKRKLKWLHGYPSQLAALGSYILEYKLPPIDSIKVITTGAEGLMDYQKKIIFKAFNIVPVEHYGLTEGVANISQLPEGDYIVDQDFAFTEFVPLNENDQIYKIIGTNYSNFSFPLIRYDTGDLAKVELTEEKAKVFSIEGREDDYITLGNGNRFGPMNQIFKNFKNVKEAQVCYKAPNNIELRLVKGEDFDMSCDEEVIINSVQERLTDKNAKFHIVYQDKVKRTESGKIKSVVTT